MLRSRKSHFAPVVEPLLGNSKAMLQLKSAALSLADQASAILILGQLGTGKETLARFIHTNSSRAKKPFIPVSCSVSRHPGFDADFFGSSNLLGCVRASDGGTLFLEDIDKLSLPMQARLFKVMQTHSHKPTGSRVTNKVNLRLICASPRHLQPQTRTGSFNLNLYGLLHNSVLKTPTLQERQGDILFLAHHFLKLQAELFGESLKGISTEVAHALQAHSWPGNVRELSQTMQQAHMLASNDMLQLADLSTQIRRFPRSASALYSVRSCKLPC